MTQGNCEINSLRPSEGRFDRKILLRNDNLWKPVYGVSIGMFTTNILTIFTKDKALTLI
jgi:hypothetical protein